MIPPNVCSTLTACTAQEISTFWRSKLSHTQFFKVRNYHDNINFTETKHIHLSRVNIKCTCERIMRENFPRNVAGFYTPALNLTCIEPEIINFSAREFLRLTGCFSKIRNSISIPAITENSAIHFTFHVYT